MASARQPLAALGNETQELIFHLCVELAKFKNKLNCSKSVECKSKCCKNYHLNSVFCYDGAGHSNFHAFQQQNGKGNCFVAP